ncbi:glycosyltransferase family 4 protein [SAR86 cluster bacterium]|nr:glycosyltransferase family 4 protein [SAR86 cluster bacterium]
MKIVLFSDYYYPTIKSGSIVIKDLANELTRLGHEAIVITFNENQNDFLTKEKNGSITIIRLRSKLRKFGMIGRLLSELRYSSSIIKGLKIIDTDNIDGMICFSPSIFYHKAIIWLKNEYRIKAYLIVRDIFPKWLLDAGILKEGLLFRFFRKEEIKLYKSVDFIGIESIKDLDYFKNYLDANTHLEVLDNWGSSLDIDKIASHDSSPLPKGLINIIYGGNMADAQDLYSLLDDLDDSALEGKAFLTLIGSGHQLSNIKSLIKKRKFRNVRLLEEVDQKSYLSILKDADIGLVSLNKKLKSNNFPLKMMGYIQQSKPILASVNPDNEIIEIIKKNDIGKVSISGDKKKFNKNLISMIQNKERLKKQGANAFELFERRFTVKIAVEKILYKLIE